LLVASRLQAQYTAAELLISCPNRLVTIASNATPAATTWEPLSFIRALVCIGVAETKVDAHGEWHAPGRSSLWALQGLSFSRPYTLFTRSCLALLNSTQLNKGRSYSSCQVNVSQS
jgi:hypothetical protein